MPASTERNVRRRALVVATLLAVAAIVATAAVAVGSHYDEADYEAGEATNFTVHTYGGAESQMRQPGAGGVSYWTEATINELPEGERVYLDESTTYRPIPSSCGPGDLDEFGVDRGGTYQGERQIDDGAVESVQSFSEDPDARDDWERTYGEYGDLTTADVEYVERIDVDWYGPDDFGTPMRVENGDRFVTAQSECLENPDAEGWYRWASLNVGETEDGEDVTQDAPTFSHWYWICDCQDREEAVETLGPPPSAEGSETPTPGDGDVDGNDGGDGARGEADDTAATADPSGDGSDEASDDGSTAGGEPDDESGTASPPDGGTPADQEERSAVQPTPTPRWDDRLVRTPTAAEGAGPGTPLATVSLLVVATLLRRRQRT